MRRAAIAAAVAAVLATGGRARANPDLHVHDDPERPAASLDMRAAQADGDPGDGDAPAIATTPQLSATDYSPLPGSRRDAQERVVFHLRAGYGVDTGTLSGDPTTTGTLPGSTTSDDGAEFDEVRSYVLGDAVLGTEGVLLPSMSTYFLSRFRYGITAAGSRNAALYDVYDPRDSRTLLVDAGYAELDGITGHGPLADVYVRAGRQYRYGNTRFITNFDGVTAGYDGEPAEVSAFFGRRVSLYFGDDPGLLGGARVTLRGDQLIGAPVDLAIDYLFFGGGSGDGATGVARQYLELEARVAAGDTRVFATGRVVDNGDLRDDGLGLGRIRLRVRHSVSRRLMVSADVDHRRAREVSYDFVSPAPRDVINVADQVGLALDPAVDSTSAGVEVDVVPVTSVEGYAFARTYQIHGTSTSGFDRPYYDVGGAIALHPRPRAHLTAQYKLRHHSLDADANAGGAAFGDTAGSGVADFHEVSADARYSARGYRASASLGAYVRIYDIRTPYLETTGDTRSGGRVDASYRFGADVVVRAAGELAQPSPNLAPELDLLYSIRVLTEISF